MKSCNDAIDVTSSRKGSVPPAVSGPDGENTARSGNQSDRRICRIPPAHELRKKYTQILTYRRCGYPYFILSLRFLRI